MLENIERRLIASIWRSTPLHVLELEPQGRRREDDDGILSHASFSWVKTPAKKKPATTGAFFAPAIAGLEFHQRFDAFSYSALSTVSRAPRQYSTAMRLMAFCFPKMLKSGEIKIISARERVRMVS
jgi:hypothetical protein